MENQDSKIAHIHPDTKLKPVNVWRQRILETVADRICDPTLQTMQKLLGVWHWSTGISLPNRKDCIIISDGALTAKVLIGNAAPLIFSIWAFLGEVRIGVMVPNDLISEATGDLFKTAFDGQPCTRVTRQTKYTMYDWIFRDVGFASTTLMADSLENSAYEQLISDGIANVSTHIYMSFMNTLIGAGVAVPSANGTTSLAKDIEEVVVDFSCVERHQISEFEQALSGIGVLVSAVEPQSDNLAYMLIKTPKSNLGECRTAISNIVVSFSGCEIEFRKAN